MTAKQQRFAWPAPKSRIVGHKEGLRRLREMRERLERKYGKERKAGREN